MAKNLVSTLLLLLGFVSLFTAVTANPLKQRATNYHVAVVDQNSKTVRVFPRNSKWSSDNIFWSFTADPPFWDNRWNDLSDVKFRKTAKHGWIALVTASGGKAGIVNVSKEKRKLDLDDVMWQATPGGNPHAIERIPGNGAIVVASSKPGKLTLYVPTDPNDISNFDKIKTSPHSYDIAGAHGVLWDPNGGTTQAKGFLWAIGNDYLHKFKVEGKGTNTKLVRVGSPIKIPGGGLGHDLQPDYSNSKILLATDTYGAYAYDTTTNKWKTLKKQKKLKSLTRHPDGEYLWVTGDKNELGQYVRFGNAVGSEKERKGWGDAEFYKARIYRTDFE